MSAIERALFRAVQKLKSVSDTPRLDAELLMAAAFEIGRDTLLLAPPGGPVPDGFEAMLDRRQAGEPVAYITGQRAFWTIDLEVGPGVLIPRPDSETLMVAAVEHFSGSPGPRRILDLGTGPGTLLLAALDEWPSASGLGVDASPEALAYARRNAQRLGLAERATLRLGDWGEGIGSRFDLILCNPPYVATDAEMGPGVVEFEPAEALFAGSDGLDDYRRLAPQIGNLIEPGGVAAIEIGHDQADAVMGLFAAHGLDGRIVLDLAGRARGVVITG